MRERNTSASQRLKTYCESAHKKIDDFRSHFTVGRPQIDGTKSVCYFGVISNILEKKSFLALSVNIYTLKLKNVIRLFQYY